MRSAPHSSCARPCSRAPRAALRGALGARPPARTRFQDPRTGQEQVAEYGHNDFIIIPARWVGCSIRSLISALMGGRRASRGGGDSGDRRTKQRRTAVAAARWPHLFEFLEDNCLLEWWDGPFKAWCAPAAPRPPRALRTHGARACCLPHAALAPPAVRRTSPQRPAWVRPRPVCRPECVCVQCKSLDSIHSHPQSSRYYEPMQRLAPALAHRYSQTQPRKVVSCSPHNATPYANPNFPGTTRPCGS